MNTTSSRPIGDATTVIDLADRDEMDDDMFPLTATKSWFTRDRERRCLPFSANMQEFIYKGSAEFGGRLVFEIGSVHAGDLLFSVALQLRLGHWLPDDVLYGLQRGSLSYDDPDTAWEYANSLGTALIQKAEFILEDQVLETIDGDFSTIFSLLGSDLNTQVGIGIDAYGRKSIPDLLQSDPNIPFPTDNGFITCILPFSFQRTRLRNGFPLLSCKEKTVRIAITLRPFHQCVRKVSTIDLRTCEETPLGQDFVFSQTGGGTRTVTASTVIPAFKDARLLTYGMMVDGKLRQALLKAPFERMYRELQIFRFDEPKKYVVNVPANGIVRLQLPIEVNGPLEEILWVIRRKAVSVNNEWTNFSNTLEFEYDATLHPFGGMLEKAVLQINGSPFVEETGDFFRRHIAKHHKGGIVAYTNFVYGYSFAQTPGQHSPSGWVNASRSSDVRLRMDIQQPGGSEDLEFEVIVYTVSLNWVRFENGIVNKVFSS